MNEIKILLEFTLAVIAGSFIGYLLYAACCRCIDWFRSTVAVWAESRERYRKLMLEHQDLNYKYQNALELITELQFTLGRNK